MSVTSDNTTSVRAADLVRFTPGAASALALILLALAIVGGAYLLEYNVGLDPADEGFLWYGAWRTLHGEVPIRDFDSYDPARYYWAALWLRLFGNDLFVLRLSSAVIHAIALLASLALLRRMTRSPVVLTAAALVIACWLFPRHKPFEPALAILGVYVAVRVIEVRAASRALLAGMFVGAAAFVGRNHGVYLIVAFVALLGWLDRQRLRVAAKDVLIFGIGVAIGYAPMLSMLALVPGFRDAFVASFHSLLRNDPLPLLWQWNELSRSAPLVRYVKLVSLGCLHLLAPAMYAYLFFRFIRDARRARPVPAVMTAAVFVGAVYLHYMFFRADYSHFAPAVAPLVVGWSALIHDEPDRARRRWLGLIAACFALFTCGSVLLQRPVALYRMRAAQHRTVEIKGRELVVPRATREMVAVTNEIGSRLPAGNVLIVPNWPVLYVLLDRQAPIRETYTLVPEDARRQDQIIRDLSAKDVRWVIVNDLTGDRRYAESSFQNTHPRVWQYILEHYAAEPLEDAPATYLLFGRRATARVP